MHIELFDMSWLHFLIRSATPSKNQDSASASTLRCLYIYRGTWRRTLSYPNEDLARDLVAFQRSNCKLGGGLEAFQDILFFPDRVHSGSYSPAGLPFQASVQNAFALPPPEAAGSPAHRLRRLKVTHHLRELPAFFGRVAKMCALQHLEIAIVYNKDSDVLEAVESEDEEEGVQHSLSSLGIEGRWSDLFPAISLCPPPSAATQFQALRLYYYGQDLPQTQEAVAQLLDLPARIIHHDHLETMTIELLATRKHDVAYNGNDLALTVGAFRPLLRYRRMVTLHLDLPCNIPLDIEFLHALAAVMGGTLRHLMVLKAVTLSIDEPTSPVLTVDDLPTIAGVILPRLETLGLDVIWDEESLSAKRHSLVVSSLLQTLYVGFRGPNSRNFGGVAKFLKRCFPGLQYLYYHLLWHKHTQWTCVMDANRYSGGFYGPGGRDWRKAPNKF